MLTKIPNGFYSNFVNYINPPCKILAPTNCKRPVFQKEYGYVYCLFDLSIGLLFLYKADNG